MAVSIENARKALDELRNSPIALDRRLAAGVLHVFINQQEQKVLTEKRKNVMRNFSSLSYGKQAQILERFILPEDKTEVVVDDNLVPFQRIGGALVACTVRNSNFHVHGNRQNGRG